ncbi:MAG TPA: FKBP-type peptidyl-prolyl cis-trans isomerase [Candidatus Obscuribacterales bacterium]
MNKIRVAQTLFSALTVTLVGFSAAYPGAQADTPKSTEVTRKVAQAECNVVTTPSGLKYQDEIVGKGPAPRMGQRVQVHYTGWLTNGQKFDSSRDRGTPFSFTLGRGEVIKGWDEGVASMKVGGRRKLTIPPNLGYGERGFPPVIPANSVLIFDVELLGVQ